MWYFDRTSFKLFRFRCSRYKFVIAKLIGLQLSQFIESELFSFSLVEYSTYWSTSCGSYFRLYTDVLCEDFFVTCYETWLELYMKWGLYINIMWTKICVKIKCKTLLPNLIKICWEISCTVGHSSTIQVELWFLTSDAYFWDHSHQICPRIVGPFLKDFCGFVITWTSNK